jgi:alkylation response protein AidB-like acyl-CoA dehydrogenase
MIPAIDQDLRRRAREFADAVVAPRAAGIDASLEYPWDIVARLVEAGFMGMSIPAEWGGQGRSFLDVAIVVEEMARACTVTARIVVEGNMGAISTVMAYGSDAKSNQFYRI